MKKIVIILCTFWAAELSGQNPQFGPISAPSTCGQFEKYELTIDYITDLPEQINYPTTPKGYYYYSPLHIAVTCTFTSPTQKQYVVNGFYYEDYAFDSVNECTHLTGVGIPAIANTAYENPTIDVRTPVKGDWRIRFAPNEIGSWRAEVTVQLGYAGTNYLCLAPCVKKIIAPTQFFNCVSGSLSNRGYITFGANQRPVKRDGSNLPLIGEHVEYDKRIKVPTSPDWNLKSSDLWSNIGGVCMMKGKIDELASHGGNYLRMGFNSNLSQRYDDNGNLLLYPFRMGQLIIYSKDNYNDLGFDAKNAYRYDQVMEYASAKEVFIRAVLFSGGLLDPPGPNSWGYWEKPNENPSFKPSNPYYSQYSGASACDFFSTSSVISSKNEDYIRYVIARWGYATNIIAWELMDEFDNVQNKPASATFCTAFTNSSTGNEIVYEWMQKFSALIKKQDHKRHLITAGGVSLDDPQTMSIFNKIYNLKDVDFIDKNREPTPPGKGIYTSSRRWNYSNICDPANFTPVSTSTGTRQAFEVNYGWFMEYPQSQIDYWNKPYVYNSYWFTTTGFAPCTSNPDIKDIINNHEILDPKHFLMHDAFFATFFGNSIISGNFYWEDELHPCFHKGRAEAQCTYHNFFDIGWYNGSLESFVETRAVMDVLLADFDQVMIARSSHFDLLGDKSFCVQKSSPGQIDNGIMVGSLHNRTRTLQKGWIKHLKYGMFTEFHNSCDYLRTLNNPPAQNDLLLAIPRNSANIQYQLKLYSFTPDYSSHTVTILQEYSPPSVFGVHSSYAYFELPAFVNKYGDYIYEAEAISGDIQCNNNIDRTLGGDIDGDGKDELIVVNKCVKVGSTFMQFYDLNSLSIEGSILHNFDKYREFLGEKDRIYIHDFIPERNGQEILLVNADLLSSNEGENFYAVVNPDDGVIIRAMSVKEILNYYGQSNLTLTTNIGNFDIDSFLELVILCPNTSSMTFIEIETGIFEAEIPSINSEFLQGEDRMLIGRYSNRIEKDYVYLFNYNPASNSEAIVLIGMEEYKYGSIKYVETVSHGSSGTDFSGWMDPCDRVLLGNVDNDNPYMYGDMNEIVFVNTDYGPNTGQAMTRWHDIKNNRVGPGLETVGNNADKLHTNDDFFLVDILGHGLKYLVSVNRNYSPNSSGISTYYLNTGISPTGFSPGLISNYSYPTGSVGNPHDGWLDNSDDHLILKGLYPGYSFVPPYPKEFPIFVNRPFTNQYFARPYDLEAGVWGQNMIKATMHYNQCPSSVAQCVNGTTTRTCYNELPGEQRTSFIDNHFNETIDSNLSPAKQMHETEPETNIPTEYLTKNSIKAYPNPSSGHLNFELDLSRDYNVKIDIYNSVGKLFGSLEKACKTGLNNLTFNGQYLAPGLYLCRIKVGGSIEIIRVEFVK